MSFQFHAAKNHPSLRSRVMVLLLRQVLRSRLVRARTPEQVRRILNAGESDFRGACDITPARLGGVPGEWVRCKAQASVGTLLYLHGGGYVACSPRTHRRITCAFARGGFDVFVPDYRLAPEHPYPAGLDDAVSVYSALLQQGTPARAFVLAGDSAGGGLTVATLLRAREQRLPTAAGAVLFSPFADLTNSGRSIRENESRCAMFDAATLGRARAFYLRDTDATDPFVSPVFADLRDLPPLLIHVSDDEILRDDSVLLAEQAKHCGVEATLLMSHGTPHVWPLFHFLPEARTCMQQSIEFLHARIQHREITPT